MPLKRLALKKETYETWTSFLDNLGVPRTYTEHFNRKKYDSSSTVLKYKVSWFLLSQYKEKELPLLQQGKPNLQEVLKLKVKEM